MYEGIFLVVVSLFGFGKEKIEGSFQSNEINTTVFEVYIEEEKVSSR